MKKGTRLLKKLMALFLVVLMSIESFAAAVSDNDGSAFITKAEFDSLKNNFQSQIDQYNTSIDAKIDNAIAAYLAGINVETKEKLRNLIEEAYNNDTKNTMFIQWRTPQATKNVDDVSAGFHIMWSWGVGIDQNNTGTGIYGYYGLCNGQSWAGGLSMIRYTDYTGTTANYTNAYYYASFPFGSRDDVNYKTVGDTSNFTLTNLYRWRCHTDIRVTSYEILSGQQSHGIDAFDYGPSEVVCDFTTDSTSKYGPANISGAAIPLGTFTRTPKMNIAHSYSRTNSSDITNNDFLNYNLAGTISGSSSFIDFDYRNNYHPDGFVTLEIQNTRPQDSHEGARSGSAVQLYWKDQPWTYWMGKDGYDNNTSFQFKYNHQKIYDLNWANLTNQYYNGIFSTPYYKYYGIPICKTPKKEGKLKFKIQFTNSGSGNYVYELMDTRFPNGDMPTTKVEQGFERVLKRETLSGTGTKTVDIEIDKKKIFDTLTGDYIYVKVVPLVSGDIVTVRVPEDITYTHNT
jgi:hypothetical protein